MLTLLRYTTFANRLKHPLDLMKFPFMDRQRDAGQLDSVASFLMGMDHQLRVRSRTRHLR